MKIEKQNIFLIGFFGIVGIVALFALSTAFSVIFTSTDSQLSGQNSMGQKLTRTGLSSFDRELAKQFMDKNGDGKCDVCGMDVNLCIDSGQLQCNMDSKSTIGILGSQHIHADFKVFVNGKSIDFADKEYYMKSSFIHVDENENKEDSSGVLHMHTTEVPLWVFFESIVIDFNKDCLTIPTGDKFCNDGDKSLKFYVNSKPNSEWENYVFKDLDKILISYGSEGDLTQQLSSITNFARSH